MENFPGPNPETIAGGSSEKSSTKRDKDTKRRPKLALTSLLETRQIRPENAVEKPAAKEVVKLSRALAEQVVRKKLEEGKQPEADAELEAEDATHEDATTKPLVHEAEGLGDNTAEVATGDSEEVSEAEVIADDETYEPLPEYNLGTARVSGGEIVIDLQNPVEEQIILRGDQPEGKTAELPEELAAALPPEASERLQWSGDDREDEIVPVPVAAGGGMIPPRPPEMPAVPFAQPPERPAATGAFTPGLGSPEFYDAYNQYGAVPPVSGRQTATTERMVTEEERDDAVHYATKAGQNRGVVAGLAAGLVYEHRKHKKREKTTEKRHQTEVKQFKTTEQANKIYSEEQERQKNEVERHLQATERKLNEVEERFQKQNEQVRAEMQSATIPKETPNEQPKIPAEHHMQSSAWLNIEVDNKTGQAVENPAFVYGEEYHKERAQESEPAAQAGIPSKEAVAHTAAAGQYAGGAANDSASLPPLDLPNASTQGPPTPLRQRPAKAEPKIKTTSGQSAGPIWPWLVALTAIVVCLALILH